MGFEGVELLGAYAGNLLELVDGGEGAVLGPVVEDPLGEDGSDAGEGVQLFESGRVEVDGSVGDGRRAGCGRGRRRVDGLGLVRLADDDLFAVGYLAGEVEGGQVDATERAAGQGEYIGYPRADRGTDEARAAYLPRHVHDHDLLTRRASSTRRLVGARLSLSGTRLSLSGARLGLSGSRLGWTG
jgi:hypothetical protein